LVRRQGPHTPQYERAPEDNNHDRLRVRVAFKILETQRQQPDQQRADNDSDFSPALSRFRSCLVVCVCVIGSPDSALVSADSMIQVMNSFGMPVIVPVYFSPSVATRIQLVQVPGTTCVYMLHNPCTEYIQY
jgi:hypothetical protein